MSKLCCQNIHTPLFYLPLILTSFYPKHPTFYSSIPTNIGLPEFRPTRFFHPLRVFVIFTRGTVPRQNYAVISKRRFSRRPISATKGNFRADKTAPVVSVHRGILLFGTRWKNMQPEAVTSLLPRDFGISCLLYFRHGAHGLLVKYSFRYTAVPYHRVVVSLKRWKQAERCCWNSVSYVARIVTYISEEYCDTVDAYCWRIHSRARYFLPSLKLSVPISFACSLVVSCRWNVLWTTAVTTLSVATFPATLCPGASN